MSPNDALLKDATKMIYCLAEPGVEYLVYFASGGEATLEVPKCRWQWYNPRNGKFEKSGTTEAMKAKFSSPSNDDMVLHIWADTFKREETR
jgi:hypothetical protein